MKNYEELFYRRHEERKEMWGLADEVCKAAVDIMLDCYGKDIGERDAIVDYDNLAINAEIVEKSELKNEKELQRAYKNGDFLFETEHYIIFQW